jgi:hypothetical protein
MPVEVRQMLVKSTVQREPDDREERSAEAPDFEELKADLLAECRQLILDTLREQRER